VYNNPSATPFSTTLTDTGAYGFDFDPTTDLIRVTNSNDENFRLSPLGGPIVQDTTLNAPGQAESITAIAYDHPFGSFGSTLFGYNFSTDELVGSVA